MDAIASEQDAQKQRITHYDMYIIEMHMQGITQPHTYHDESDCLVQRAWLKVAKQLVPCAFASKPPKYYKIS